MRRVGAAHQQEEKLRTARPHNRRILQSAENEQESSPSASANAQPQKNGGADEIQNSRNAPALKEEVGRDGQQTSSTPGCHKTENKIKEDKKDSAKKPESQFRLASSIKHIPHP